MNPSYPATDLLLNSGDFSEKSTFFGNVSFSLNEFRRDVVSSSKKHNKLQIYRGLKAVILKTK